MDCWPWRSRRSSRGVAEPRWAADNTSKAQWSHSIEPWSWRSEGLPETVRRPTTMEPPELVCLLISAA